PVSGGAGRVAGVDRGRAAGRRTVHRGRGAGARGRDRRPRPVPGAGGRAGEPRVAAEARAARRARGRRRVPAPLPSRPGRTVHCGLLVGRRGVGANRQRHRTPGGLTMVDTGDNERERWLQDTIAEVGWAVVAVTAEPAHAFTVGLWESYGEPELVMFGLE